MSISRVKIRAAFGELEGVDQGDVHVFRGIRFAMPPVGALRFQPPEPTGPWSGTLDATRFGPICPQPVNTGGSVN